MSTPVIDLKRNYTVEECKKINNFFIEAMSSEFLTRIEELEKKSIQGDEYREHKDKCSRTFEVFGNQLSDLNRAIFGDEKLLQKGIQRMTTEMYDIMKEEKANKKVKKSFFPSIVTWSGGISTLIVALYLVIELFKKLSKLG